MTIQTVFGAAIVLAHRTNFRDRRFIQVLLLEGPFAGQTTWIPTGR